MTYFCSIGSQILYIFETHGIGQTLSSLERYLVSYYIHCVSRLVTVSSLNFSSTNREWRSESDTNCMAVRKLEVGSSR